MTNAGNRSFVYVTYIRTTPERLWSALTDPEFARQYWRGVRPEAEWKLGGSWKLILPDGRVGDIGEIVAFEPSKRLSIRWRNEFKPELKAEGWSLCTIEIEPVSEAVKLTVSHIMEREGSKFIGAISDGWPQILSNLKSLLETGSVVLPPMEFPLDTITVAAGDDVTTIVNALGAQLRDNASSLSLLARFTVRESDRETVKSAFTNVKSHTLAELGCGVFDLNEDAQNPGRFLVYERWRSLADLDAHLRKKHTAELRTLFHRVIVDGPEFQVLVPAS